MRIVFMGTPEFALPSLRALVDKKYKIEAVVTQPDRPGGRGKKLRRSPVKVFAQRAGLPVYQPDGIRNPEFIEVLENLAPDVVAVAAFGQILPEKILDLPRYGCINVHASLLPAYRGAAPIHRAVMNGEKETGVTIMQMDAGLDTGDIILQHPLPIGPDDTTGDVHDSLAELGAKMLVEALVLIAGGKATLSPQDDAKASYAPALTREDEIIDWRQSAVEIKNRVRGLNPWPGARTVLGGKLLKVWRARPVAWEGDLYGKPGRVLWTSEDRGIIVETGNGVVSIEELQLQGKRRMSTSEFLRGNPVLPGTVLE